MVPRAMEGGNQMSAKSNGRKPKSGETRKAVTFRLPPATAEKIKKAAADFKVSQSDMLIKIIEDSYMTD